MGIAAMVIGIVSAILGVIPLCNYFALIPAVVGLVLGIIDIPMSKKNAKPIGFGVAGVALNGAAIIFILFWSLVIVGASSGAAKTLTDAASQLNQLQNDAQTLQDAAQKLKDAATSANP